MRTRIRDTRSAGWAQGPAPVLLLLHGYGSNENDLTQLVPHLQLGLPWASLRAPIELGSGAAAWFTITTPGSPDLGPVAEATAAIWDWVDANLDPAAPVVPIGFSQGGLMVTQLLRTRPARVLAPVVLGGFVLGAPQPADDELAAYRPAVFWGRGSQDTVIAAHAVARTESWLPDHTTLTAKVYPGVGHAIGADAIVDVRDFVTANVGVAHRG
ncbi:alpha/beta hydrolase [Pengzhenrongella sicca]|uniref:Dienelactone hydrolase family protein n=1 Tax=Pengzhenrongella sicca TaxID=2819238 RepID=A0A8A4ZC71_9MICO|nr:dienelactone hydrolase family protein [Pengzhenrongella sicca]QTE28097.1 dienelactone hydrolase family protein [Pengzhenrongella sicca]